jgi:hypothetical protein
VSARVEHSLIAAGFRRVTIVCEHGRSAVNYVHPRESEAAETRALVQHRYEYRCQCATEEGSQPC